MARVMLLGRMTNFFSFRAKKCIHENLPVLFATVGVPETVFVDIFVVTIVFRTGLSTSNFFSQIMRLSHGLIPFKTLV